MDRPSPKRIVVVGTTGSGKSSYAARLAATLGCAVIELDELYWLPGWTPRPPDQFRALVERAAAADAWVCAGNYTAVRDLVWSRADTIVWLDLGFWRTLGQLLGRTVYRYRTRAQICNGNFERVSLIFSRQSIILWFFKTYRPNRARFGAIFAAPGEWSAKRLVRLTSRRAMAAFCGSCAARPAAAMAGPTDVSEAR
jgi:hypothetical protein